MKICLLLKKNYNFQIKIKKIKKINCEKSFRLFPFVSGRAQLTDSWQGQVCEGRSYVKPEKVLCTVSGIS